jgi:hypothetical protein
MHFLISVAMHWIQKLIISMAAANGEAALFRYWVQVAENGCMGFRRQCSWRVDTRIVCRHISCFRFSLDD